MKGDAFHPLLVFDFRPFVIHLIILILFKIGQEKTPHDLVTVVMYSTAENFQSRVLTAE